MTMNDPGSSVWYGGVTIRTWRLRNFKSVADEDVTLSPLTVLVGANSAGKSTLLQSILAASQAAAGQGGAFALNGGTLRLGTVDQTRYAGPDADAGPIGIGGLFVMDSRVRPWGGGPVEAAQSAMWRRVRARMERSESDVWEVEWSIELNGSPTGQPGQALVTRTQLLVQEPPGLFPRVLARLDAKRRGDTKDGPQAKDYAGDLVRADAHESVAGLMLAGGIPLRVRVEVDLARHLAEIWRRAVLTSARRVAERRPQDVVQEDLPQRLMEVADEAVSDIRQVLEEHREEIATQGAPPEFFLESFFEPGSKTLAMEWLLAVQQEGFADRVTAQLGDLGKTTTWAEVPEIEGASRLLQDFLRSRVQYLGPLREDPRVVYQDAPEAQSGYVGSKGEYCAAVLQNSGRRKLEDVPIPPQRDDDVFPPTLGRVALQHAVNQWGKYLGIIDQVSTSDQGRVGLGLQFQADDVGVALDPTSVGTGVSQLLPVLVMCLQAPPGSLLLIEQPELHLNPKVQQRLADFLLAIAQSGRQLIVETHSEYLVSRFRRRIAQDSSDRIQSVVGFLFAERERASTHYRQVKTTPYGALENWPADFFDQAAEEAEQIMRAAVQKRRRSGGTRR